MTDIRFRAWDKKQKQMFRVRSLNIDDCFANLTNDPETDIKGHYKVYFSNLELMQFTGLRDKAGKEIYEGDILRVDWLDKRYKPHNVVCKYNEGEAQFVLGEGANTKHDAENYFEVIGNVWENPELLKSGL